jgi:hypothetical protein
MNRADYAFHDLSQRDYQAIIAAGTMQGTSPLLPKENYDALIRESQASNVDPRVALAWMLWEDHFGTDPGGGVELARVFNFGGIKWAGQPNAFDSGIQVPPDEQPGTYAGFHDAGGWFHELYRTLTNQYCGPYFSAGDLVNCASVYITGRPDSGHGQERVDQWQYYLRHYPPTGGNTVPDGVFGEDLIAKFETQIGHAHSGDYDPRNGINHPWAYYCRAGVESTGRNCGLDVTARTSARDARLAATDQGLLNTSDPPEHGAVMQFDQRFYYPDEHTGLWNAQKGQLLGTLTDGTGVGYRNWGPQTNGYAGWYRLPGVAGEYRTLAPAPPMNVGNLVIPGNPYDTGTDPDHRLGLGGAFRRVWELLPDPFVILGFPTENEYSATVTDADGTARDRTVQAFERGTLIFQPELPSPWNVVLALRTQKITRKAA